jgi:hypothetical protein
MVRRDCLGDRSCSVEVCLEDGDVRVVLKPAGFIQGEGSSVELSGLDSVALAAADDSECSECGGELEGGPVRGFAL